MTIHLDAKPCDIERYKFFAFFDGAKLNSWNQVVYLHISTTQLHLGDDLAGLSLRGWM